MEMLSWTIFLVPLCLDIVGFSQRSASQLMLIADEDGAMLISWSRIFIISAEFLKKTELSSSSFSLPFFLCTGFASAQYETVVIDFTVLFCAGRTSQWFIIQSKPINALHIVTPY